MNIRPIITFLITHKSLCCQKKLFFMSSLSDREDNSYSIVGYKVVMLDSDRVCAMSRCTNLLYSFIRLSNSLSIIEEVIIVYFIS